MFTLFAQLQGASFFAALASMPQTRAWFSLFRFVLRVRDFAKVPQPHQELPESIYLVQKAMYFLHGWCFQSIVGPMMNPVLYGHMVKSRTLTLKSELILSLRLFS